MEPRVRCQEPLILWTCGSRVCQHEIPETPKNRRLNHMIHNSRNIWTQICAHRATRRRETHAYTSQHTVPGLPQADTEQRSVSGSISVWDFGAGIFRTPRRSRRRHISVLLALALNGSKLWDLLRGRFTPWWIAHSVLHTGGWAGSRTELVVRRYTDWVSQAHLLNTASE
jgi:hypothetical protein